MADTSILVTSATAEGGVQQIIHKATTDFVGSGCLSYLALIGIEVWSASSNNRAGATKVGEITPGGQLVQTGLARSVTRYSWYRAKDVSSNLGDWYPASATAGISATTSDQVPPAGSVGPTQVAGNFSTLSSISANFGDITSGTVTGVTFTGNLFRTAVSGRRIEINGTANYVQAYNSAGTLVAAFGENTTSGFDEALITANRSSASDIGVMTTNLTGVALASYGFSEFYNGSSSSKPIVYVGPRLSFTGISFNSVGRSVFQTNYSLAPAILCEQTASGANAHCMVFDAKPTGALGGAGVLGVSQASGGWAFYQNRGTLGPFTGSHPSLIAKSDEAQIGDIVCDLRVLARIDIDNTLTEVGSSGEEKQRAVIGVLSKRIAEWTPETVSIPPIMAYFQETHDYAVMNAVGEGQINVCGLGGDLEPGDYICASSIPGKGMRQNDTEGDADDLLRRCTVARVRERVTFSSPSEIKRAACIYLCG